MLALRLTGAAGLAVQLRRLLVATASAGTGFLLLCSLGHALTHPYAVGGSALRLAWCAAPLAATAHLALAVARTDPATRPRTGLSAAGLGPGRLMAASAASTAVSGSLGSVVALLLFLRLRGDLAGRPVTGFLADTCAVGLPLPFPAVLTLLVLTPGAASAAVAVALRPRRAPRSAPAGGAARRYGRFGAYGLAARETFGAYGRFGARRAAAPAGAPAARTAPGAEDTGTARTPLAPAAVPAGSAPAAVPAGGVLAAAGPAPALASGSPAPAGRAPHPRDAAPPADPAPAPRTAAVSLPWGISVLAAGLAVEAMADRPGGAGGPGAGVLAGWALTALGLTLAGPGLTQVCGRLLQAVRPGAVRLLAGRVLMEEGRRLGRPLGVVCAVASAAYAAAVLRGADGSSFGPLSALGAALVSGCAVATLLISAVEAKHGRADARSALLRLGAPARVLRGAAALRAVVLLAVFGPLTLAVAELAALPLRRS